MGWCGDTLVSVTIDIDNGFVVYTSVVRNKLSQVCSLVLQIIVPVKHESSLFISESVGFGEFHPASVTLLR